MARWKLTEPHYLRVEGTRWEYSEIDRLTGRPKRTQYEVPLYINPNYDDDLRQFGQDYEAMGVIIIVSDGVDSLAKDLIFKGDPTPSMIPLDDDAREKSAKFKKIWEPQAEGSLTYAQEAELRWMSELDKLRMEMGKTPQVEGFKEFADSMSAMMKQQTEILAMLAKAQMAPQAERRV